MAGNKRDTQRSKVYRFEWRVESRFAKCGCNDVLSLDECRDLVHRMLGYHGITAPVRVTDGRGRRRACGSARTIKLPVNCRNEFTVAHEVCHTVQARKGLSCAWHGPEFTRLLVNTLNTHLGVSRQILRDCMKRHGIKVAPYSDRRLRTSRRKKSCRR